MLVIDTNQSLDKIHDSDNIKRLEFKLKQGQRKAMIKRNEFIKELQGIQKERVSPEFLQEYQKPQSLTRTFFSIPEDLLSETTDEDDITLTYGDIELNTDNYNMGIQIGKDPSTDEPTFYKPEYDEFLENQKVLMLTNTRRLNLVDGKMKEIIAELNEFEPQLNDLRRFDIINPKLQRFNVTKEGMTVIEDYDGSEILPLTEEQNQLLETYLKTEDGTELTANQFIVDEEKASNGKTWDKLNKSTQSKIKDAVKAKRLNLLKDNGFLDDTPAPDSLSGKIKELELYQGESTEITKGLMGKKKGTTSQIKGYLENQRMGIEFDDANFVSFTEYKLAEIPPLPEPPTFTDTTENIKALEQKKPEIQQQQGSDASRLAKIENTINSLKYSSSVNEFLGKLYDVLDTYIFRLNPEIKIINSEYAELKKKPEVTEDEKNEFNDKIGALNIKVQKVMKYVKLYYSMVVTIRSVRISNELGAILTYSVWTDLTRKIQNVSDKNSLATSKHAYYVYDLCESNKKDVYTKFQTNFKGILGENSFIRTPNQFEGAKRISIWDFKESNNINPGLHKLLLDSVGVTEAELLFLDRISTQEENVAKYVALLKESYTEKDKKKQNEINKSIYNFCKTTKLISPHDLYTEKPKEVEFCAGIRGHLVGSDAKNNSLINELSSGRLCRFQLPIYKDYYETWKGMQALYKSYKNSNYSQQIKASLLLVNKVSLILESLGEGVKTSKLILEKGSKDELYFANGEQENGIIYYGENDEFLEVNPFLKEVDDIIEDKQIVIKSPSESKYAIYHLYLNHIKYLAIHLGKNTWQKNSSKSIIADKTKLVEEFTEYMVKNPISLDENSALAIARFMIFFSGLLLDMYRSISNNFNNGKDFANWVQDQSTTSDKDLEKKSKPSNECQKAVSKFYQVSTKAFTVFYQITLKELYKKGLITASKYSESKTA